MSVNKILTLSLIPFSLIFLCSISINFISTINAQVFEFNEEDYFSSEEKEEKEEEEENTPTTNSKDASATANSEDTDKEVCIDNPMKSVSVLNSDIDSDSSYSSAFHFIKKYDKNGTLIDSWGNVGSQDGQFLHAHGITIDSQDNVYVSDAEKCNIQKFDSNGNFITMWGKEGQGQSEFKKPWGIAVDSKDNVYVSDQTMPRVQKFDSNGTFIDMWGKEG